MRRVTTINSILSVTLGSSKLWGYRIPRTIRQQQVRVVHFVVSHSHLCTIYDEVIVGYLSELTRKERVQWAFVYTFDSSKGFRPQSRSTGFELTITTRGWWQINGELDGPVWALLNGQRQPTTRPLLTIESSLRRLMRDAAARTSFWKLEWRYERAREWAIDSNWDRARAAGAPTSPPYI